MGITTMLLSSRLAIYTSLCFIVPLAVWECAVSTTRSLTTDGDDHRIDESFKQMRRKKSVPRNAVGEEPPFELRKAIVEPALKEISRQQSKPQSQLQIRQRPAARAAPSSTSSPTDDVQTAFDLALARAQARSHTRQVPLSDNLKSLYPDFKLANETDPREFEPRLLNLIRIPKAGSSALSATARALVGCGPDGYACCDPTPEFVPACPLPDLSCPAVRGCTGHNPDYRYQSGAHAGVDEPTITNLRHPASRALSAFFYSRPHRPPGGDKSWGCFEKDFMPSPRWRNPVTKMLSGYFPYRALHNANDPAFPLSVHVAKKRLCSMVWFGISEMPIPSALLMYEVEPFSQLLPNPVAFGLPARDADDKTKPRKGRKGNTLRTNDNNAEYTAFKNVLFPQMNGTALVEEYNADDMEVYRFGVALFCERIRDSGLIEVAVGAGLSEHFRACEQMRSNDEEPKICTALKQEAPPPLDATTSTTTS